MHIGRSIIIPAILALGLLRDDGHAPAPRRVIPRADLAPLRPDITTIAALPGCGESHRPPLCALV